MRQKNTLFLRRYCEPLCRYCEPFCYHCEPFCRYCEPFSRYCESFCRHCEFSAVIASEVKQSSSRAKLQKAGLAYFKLCLKDGLLRFARNDGREFAMAAEGFAMAAEGFTMAADGFTMTAEGFAMIAEGLRRVRNDSRRARNNGGGKDGRGRHEKTHLI